MKTKESVTVHMIVKNEDRFVWYAIASVINFTDQILIYDTGSRDDTVQIIKSFHSPKIIFEEKGEVDAEKLVKLRREQMDKTKTDWFWLVDGDEVYPQKTALEIMGLLQKGKYEGGVVRRYDLLGDIYHYQSESVGQYEVLGQKGHLVLRLLNKKKINSLHLEGIYPNEGYYDRHGIPVINHLQEKFFITQNRLFHATYLKRSSLGENLSDTLHRNKHKIETGNKINEKEIPEVFFQKKTPSVPDITRRRDIKYETAATIITPIKKIKRRIWKTLL